MAIDINTKLAELNNVLERINEAYVSFIRTKDIETIISLQRDIATQVQYAAKIIAELKTANRPELNEITSTDMIRDVGLPMLHPTEERRPQEGYAVLQALQKKITAILGVKA